MRKTASKSYQKLLIVLGCIELFGSGKFYVSKFPLLLKKTYRKMMRQLGWNIFQECENPVFWVLIPKNVEDEALSGEKRFAVSGNPIFRCQAAHPHCKDSKLCRPSSPLNISWNVANQKKRMLINPQTLWLTKRWSHEFTGRRKWFRRLLKFRLLWWGKLHTFCIRWRFRGR